jgi:hypothetical protein
MRIILLAELAHHTTDLQSHLCKVSTHMREITYMWALANGRRQEQSERKEPMKLILKHEVDKTSDTDLLFIITCHFTTLNLRTAHVVERGQ